MLSGNFLVKFEFTEAELRSWLISYYESDPEAAQSLVSKVQTDAFRTLSKKAGKGNTTNKEPKPDGFGAT